MIERPEGPATIGRRAALRLAAVGAAVALLPRPAAARVNTQGGAAIGGTDPVAYRTEGRPVAGRPDIAFAWGGATWRFASTANRDRFAADPARFAPAFGGFCAYAVARGYTATIEPEAWRIVDGRLYLNYDLRTRAVWDRDIPGEIARGEANWPRLDAARPSGG